MAKLGAILALLVMAALLAALPRMAEAQGMPDPPHIFQGIATIDGLPAPPGTELTAWNGNQLVGLTEAEEGGAFTLIVSRAYGSISFRIANRRAKEIAPEWIAGGVDGDFALTVSPEPEPGLHPATIAAMAIAVAALLMAAGLFLILRRRK